MGSFVRPTTLDEALAALAAGPRVLLAGGTDHYPARATHRPNEDVVDISALPGLRAIVRRGAAWWIPCQATWTDLIRTELPPAFDALKQAARQVGGVQIQNAGTVVGNICNASPAADGVPGLLALDASVELAAAVGHRTLPLAEFLLGPRRIARRANELVLGLRIPDPGAARGVFQKLGARSYLVISIAMVAVVADIGADGRVAMARVAVGACSPTAIRLPALEAALVGQAPSPDLVRPQHLTPLAPITDIRAPAPYRDKAALELVRRAVAALAA